MRVVLVFIAVLALFSLTAQGEPHPPVLPVTVYGWVFYDDGSPAPPGLPVEVYYANGSLAAATKTGYRTFDGNAYILSFAEGANPVELRVNGVAVWRGAARAGDVLNINVTIPVPQPPPPAPQPPPNATVTRLAAMPPGFTIQPVPPDESEGSNGGVGGGGGWPGWAWLGLGAAAGLLLALAARR